MLRQGTKENFIRILQDVLVLCKTAITKDADSLIAALQESQDAVISVGTGLEKTVENPMPIITKMESLCEVFYMLSLNLDKRSEYGQQITDLLEEIILEVSHLPVSYQIVFFPYKADMWDSLESIWLACKDEPVCDCKVVPIPYYHYDADQDKWLYQYEIDKFPDYVPVVHYADYDLNEQADAAFVHNPYDEYNHVTHIHSEYYSYNLKKYVSKLFYVPYYVTSGFVAENHKALSVYNHADYIVVQSESFKDGLKDTGYAHKAIVMGSPKLDRVIRLSGSKDNIPEEWKPILQGKKSLMLNTSLHQFLVDGEVYLQKLSYVFDVVKRRGDVVLVWRPHPLLYSTIESMRPELLPMYEQLQQKFLDENIGILDTTPDIIHTVAAVDGYMGEASSSVVNLFEAAGKPVFILNNYITEDFSEEEKRQVLLFSCNKIDDVYYCTSVESSKVFKVQGNDWRQVKEAAQLQTKAKWRVSSIYGEAVGSDIYYAPGFSEDFWVYNVCNNTSKSICFMKTKASLLAQCTVQYQNKVFYLPAAMKCIMVYDITNNTWKRYHEPIRELQSGIKERIVEDIYGHFVDDQYVWMTNLYSNRVLRFDMKNGVHDIYEIGDKDVRYSAIAVVGSKIYLSEANTGVIQVWNYELGKMEMQYDMPSGYRVEMNANGRKIAFAQMFLGNGNLYATPVTSNYLIKADIETGAASIIAKALWDDAFQNVNGYNPRRNFVANFAQQIDTNTLLVQCRRDAALLEINMSTGEYQIHHPMLAADELEKMLVNEDGFEKLYTDGEFARRESRYFSLDGFMDDLVNGRLRDAMVRQKEEMQTMAVNLDGSCGKKIHEFVRDIIKK